MSEHYGLHLETGVIGLTAADAPPTAKVVRGPDDEGGEPVREPDQEDDDGVI